MSFQCLSSSSSVFINCYDNLRGPPWPVFMSGSPEDISWVELASGHLYLTFIKVQFKNINYIEHFFQLSESVLFSLITAKNVLFKNVLVWLCCRRLSLSLRLSVVTTTFKLVTKFGFPNLSRVNTFSQKIQNNKGSLKKWNKSNISTLLTSVVCIHAHGFLQQTVPYNYKGLLKISQNIFR